jgi:hypothetical protein
MQDYRKIGVPLLIRHRAMPLNACWAGFHLRVKDGPLR